LNALTATCRFGRRVNGALAVERPKSAEADQDDSISLPPNCDSAGDDAAMACAPPVARHRVAEALLRRLGKVNRLPRLAEQPLQDRLEGLEQHRFEIRVKGDPIKTRQNSSVRSKCGYPRDFSRPSRSSPRKWKK
jgi:hypothetical protein